MSHRIIIGSGVQALLQDPEVRAQLTPKQLERIDAICSGEQPPCEDDMHYELRMLGRAYSDKD